MYRRSIFALAVALCVLASNQADSFDALGGVAAPTRILDVARTTFAGDGSGFDVQLGPNDEVSARPGGLPQFDAIRSMITNGPGRNGVGQVTAIAGTVRGLVDNLAPGNNGYSVGVFGNATCEVDGCDAWGSNFTVTDAGPRQERNGARRSMQGAEIDVNVWSPATVAGGVNVVGNFLTPNTSPTFGYNLQVNGRSPAWAQGYSTGPGTTVAAFVAGPARKEGVNVPSQPVVFNYFDDKGQQASLELRAALGPQGVVLAVDGAAGFYSRIHFEALATPGSSTAPCEPGQFGDDANFHYVCVSRNKWKRSALADF